ncbi:MAG TPA: YdeI/OmpD-associated family protein [Usitatibacter sp.]|nr:YdeI/OmpD-associated family protein [Usitatibacter sp.]
MKKAKKPAVLAPRIPPDLAKALRAYESAEANFRRFPASQRRGIIGWIVAAKRPETRAKRVAETAQLADWNVQINLWRWGH